RQPPGGKDRGRTVIPAAALRQITESIWSAIAGLAVERVDPDDVRARTGSTFAGCVHVTGAWSGAIALHCSEPLARRVAAAIFDVDAALATIRQTQDAVGGLVNMAGGHVNALLP